MPRNPNLAELARAALTARDTQGAGGVYAMPTHPDSGTEVTVADICMRDDLGFVLLFHRRKDGHFAEELYFSTRLDDGSWAAADHLSGDVMGIEPTSTRELASILNGRSLVPFGESETLLFTGRPEADDGYEPLRFYELIVDGEVDHLDIEITSPEATPTRGPVRKALISHVVLFALFPGERVTIRAMTGKGPGSHPLGEPCKLASPGAEPVADPAG